MPDEAGVGAVGSDDQQQEQSGYGEHGDDEFELVASRHAPLVNYHSANHRAQRLRQTDTQTFIHTPPQLIDTSCYRRSKPTKY